MSLSSECVSHEWSWDPTDDMGCPVCYGIEITEQRIIKFLEELKEYWSEKVEFEYGTVSAINVDEAIAFIKGETNEH